MRTLIWRNVIVLLVVLIGVAIAVGYVGLVQARPAGALTFQECGIDNSNPALACQNRKTFRQSCEEVIRANEPNIDPACYRLSPPISPQP